MEQDVILCLKNLTKSYGAKEVLKGINLTVTRGQFIGYIGPNGAGKSTTIKILLGIESGYAGKVEMVGKEITETDFTYKEKSVMSRKSPSCMTISQQVNI